MSMFSSGRTMLLFYKNTIFILTKLNVFVVEISIIKKKKN